MPLVSSTITQNVDLGGGSQRITEIHIDHLGNKYPVDYTASPGADTAALLTQHGNNILVQLGTQELARIRKQVIDGVDIRTITQEFSRLADLQDIFIKYLAEADADKARATTEQSRIETAKAAIS